MLKRTGRDAMLVLCKPKAAGLIGRFLRDERGTTAIEYAIIASGVSIVIVGTVATLGTAVKGFYSSVANALK
jgi:pilus assembly protein Flp/PilA